MHRSALMDRVKDQRKDSLKMLDEQRLRRRTSPPITSHGLSNEVFKQYIMDAEPYLLD